MLIACWSVKGGSGTSVVTTMLALALARWSGRSGNAWCSGDDDGPLLVDLTGDLPAVLGVPPASEPGVHDWMHVHGVGAGALAHLAQPLGGLRFVARGEPQPPDDVSVAGRLIDAVAELGATAAADCGRLTNPVTSALVEGAAVSLLVVRPCYLALRRALDAAVRPSAVVLVDEPGRALGPAEVEDAVGAPVVVIRSRPSVARAVDSGLLSWRPPRRLVRALVDVAGVAGVAGVAAVTT